MQICRGGANARDDTGSLDGREGEGCLRVPRVALKSSQDQIRLDPREQKGVQGLYPACPLQCTLNEQPIGVSIMWPYANFSRESMRAYRSAFKIAGPRQCQDRAIYGVRRPSLGFSTVFDKVASSRYINIARSLSLNLPTARGP